MLSVEPAFARNRIAWLLARLPATVLDLTSPRRSLQFSSRDMQEISPLPDAGSELAITPDEPLAPARPSALSRKWSVAITASCLLHAAVAAAFLIAPAETLNSRDAIQAEGADQSGANVVGSALDGQAPGAMNVTLVPDPQPAKPEATKPVPPIPPSQPPSKPTKQVPRPSPEAVQQPAKAPDILVAGAPRPDDQSVAPRTETATSTETPTSPAVQPESNEAAPAFDGQPPIPSARPSATGLGGSSQTNDARGAADGEERDAVISSKGKKQAAAGNAINPATVVKFRRSLPAPTAGFRRRYKRKLATMPGSLSLSWPTAASATCSLPKAQVLPSLMNSL